MAAVHKIMEDFYEEPFDLVALHSSLEDYELVYFINLHLKSRLRRCRSDFELSPEVSFPIFEWKDEPNDIYWSLVTNNSLSEYRLPRTDLFKEEKSYTPHYLVPERKEVDYFIKVEQTHIDIEADIVRLLLAIPRIITAYRVDIDSLKSKNNLIFL